MNIKTNNSYVNKPTLHEFLQTLNIYGSKISIITHKGKMLTASYMNNTLTINENELDSDTLENLPNIAKHLLGTVIRTISVGGLYNVCIKLTNAVITDYINRSRKLINY